MSRTEFLKALDELLQLPSGTLTGTEKLEDLENWDSVAMIEFIALADTNNQAKLAARELARCQTVSELLTLAKVEA